MKKNLALVFGLSMILLLGLVMPVSASSNRYQAIKTNKITKQAYVSVDNRSHAIWNAKHSSVLGDLRSFPKTTWFVDELVTMKHGRQRAVYAKVKSANGVHRGLVWRGYLKLGSHLKVNYSESRIVTGFNNKVVQARAKEENREISVGSNANWVTVVSPKINQLSKKFMRQLTNKDYRTWQAQARASRGTPGEYWTRKSLEKSWADQSRCQDEYNLRTYSSRQLGYVDLKSHPTEAQVIKSLAKQIIRVGSNGELYSGTELRQVLYTGAAVRIDKKRQAIFFVATIATNQREDMFVNPVLK